jgi:outer membrane protein
MQLAVAGVGIGVGSGAAQTAAPVMRQVPVAMARQIALHSNPRIGSAGLNAQAADAVARETRAAFYPLLTGNLTGVGSERGTAVEAGALTTSSLYSRASGGVVLNQLITDFGRTAGLSRAAGLRAAATAQNASATRAEIVLEVDRAYADALAADSVLRVARATVDYRRTALRQVEALAQSSLRSTLDVSFLQVNVSDAELLLFRAENQLRAARARLSAAMGNQSDADFELVDEPLPPAPAPDMETLVRQALRERPDLAALRLDTDAARSLAQAEKRLSAPTITLLAAAGGSPVLDGAIRGTYAAAGVNVSVPLFNGGLFAARRSEAELRAAAVQKDMEALVLGIARDVRLAWLDENNAWQRLDVTARIVEQSNRSVRLAQARYDSGLGAIVELNQAQLSQTTAQINAAAAKYEYIERVAELDFVTGNVPVQ